MARKPRSVLAFALSAALVLGTLPAPALAEMAEEAMGTEPVAATQPAPKPANDPAPATQPGDDAVLGEEPIASQPQQVPAPKLATEPVSVDVQLAPEAESEPGAAPAPDAQYVPEPVAEMADVPQLSMQSTSFFGDATTFDMGYLHSAAVRLDGSLWMWGQNRKSQLGDGTTAERNSPVKVMDDVASVSVATYDYSAAVKTDGGLWTWGDNGYGQLGDGTFEMRSTPKKVMEDVRIVALGDHHTAAIKTDGTLWTWGDNGEGRLGKDDYSENDYTSWRDPTPTKIMDNVVAVSLGSNHSAAIKTDGSLWMWGNNGFGQLGDGTNEYRSKPKKIMDGVAAVSLGGYNSAAIKTDGSLWTWGSNNQGQLGDGTTTNRNRPVKVMDSVVVVSMGGEHASAIKTDGSLWTWGFNKWGQLGDGNTQSRSRPVNVMDGVRAVSLGSHCSAATKGDGTLWVWGCNSDFGRLGDGTTVDRHSPVKLIGDVMLPGSSSQPTTWLFGTDWSAVFDPEWYAEKNPDVVSWATHADGTMDWGRLLQHFVNNGAKEGRASKQSFELASYYNANADLRRAFGTDWARYYDHYRTNGQRENRTCSGVTALRGLITSRDGVDWSSVYDGTYYAQRNTDVREWATRRFASGSVVDDAALLSHFVNSGTKECRASRQGFDVRSYYNANSDLRAAFGGSADWSRYYRHYATNGAREGRRCAGANDLVGSVNVLSGTNWSAVYDRAYYGQRNPDIVRWATRKCGSATVLDDYAMLSHFVNSGRKEGRASKATFELTSYYNANADLRRAFGTDWARYYEHYRANGQRENRTATNVGQLRGAPTTAENVNWAPVYDANHYAQRNSDVANWARRSFASGSVVDDAALLQHFVNNGAKEARASKQSFDVRVYRNKNADLDRAFGNDWKSYYRHYALYGANEHRACV